MTLSAGTVSIGVKPDTSKFGDELRGGIMGGVGDIGSSLGSTLMKGLGIVGIAATIGGALKTGFSELSDASAGTAQLAAGIKSTGAAAGVTVNGLNDLASSIQNYSGQTDDSIVKSEQLLLTFTNIKNSAGAGNDIFNQATKATADLAAKMGGDASGAAIQLGKALNDPVKGITALSRVGVSFDDQQKAQIKTMVAHGNTMAAQKIILAELNKEFGGAAQAYGNSLPGMIDRSKRAFEDLTQTLAGTLLPIITPVLEGLLKGFQFVQPFIQQFADNVTKWMSQLAPTFKTLVPQVVQAVTAFSPLHTLFEVLKPVLPQIIQLVVSLAKSVGGALSNAFKQIMPALLQVAGVLINSLSGIIQMLMPTITTLVNLLGRVLGDVIRQLTPVVVLLVKAVASLIQPLMPVIQLIVKLALDAVQPLITALMPLIDLVLPLVVGLLKMIIPYVAGFAQVLEAVLIPIIETLITWLGAIIKTGFQVIGFFTTLGGHAKTVGKILGDAFSAAGRVITGVFNGAVNIIKSSMNMIIDLINGAIDGINKVASTAKGVTGGLVNVHVDHIPKLAKGGIVPATPGGQIVQVAEAGQAEAIIPLDKLGGLKGTTINYYAAKNDSIDAKQKLVDAVQRAKLLGAI